ncbi:hypothetical protein O5D80_000340 [Batrachochytrium dendrobatidis]|nr:hypothetical protein O5D80_000340 [Batrachochytrium dendrobatidis]
MLGNNSQSSDTDSDYESVVQHVAIADNAMKNKPFLTVLTSADTTESNSTASESHLNTHRQSARVSVVTAMQIEKPSNSQREYPAKLLACDSIVDTPPAARKTGHHLRTLLEHLYQMHQHSDPPTETQFVNAIKAVRKMLADTVISTWEEPVNELTLDLLVNQYLGGAESPTALECGLLLSDLVDRVEGCDVYLARNDLYIKHLWKNSALSNQHSSKSVLVKLLDRQLNPSTTIPLNMAILFAQEITEFGEKMDNTESETLSLLATLSSIPSYQTSIIEFSGFANLCAKLVKISASMNMDHVGCALRILFNIVKDSKLQEQLFSDKNIKRILDIVFEVCEEGNTPLELQKCMIDLMICMLESSTLSTDSKKLFNEKLPLVEWIIKGLWQDCQLFGRVLRLMAALSKELPLMSNVWILLRELDYSLFSKYVESHKLRLTTSHSCWAHIACLIDCLSRQTSSTILLNEDPKLQSIAILYQLFGIVWNTITYVSDNWPSLDILYQLPTMSAKMHDALHSYIELWILIHKERVLLDEIRPIVGSINDRRAQLQAFLDAFNQYESANPTLHNTVILLLSVEWYTEMVLNVSTLMVDCLFASTSLSRLFCNRVISPKYEIYMHNLQVNTNQTEFARIMRKLLGHPDIITLSVDQSSQTVSQELPKKDDLAPNSPPPHSSLGSSIGAIDHDFVEETQHELDQEAVCTQKSNVRHFASAQATDHHSTDDLEARFRRMMNDFNHATELHQVVSDKNTRALKVECETLQRQVEQKVLVVAHMTAEIDRLKKMADKQALLVQSNAELQEKLDKATFELDETRNQIKKSSNERNMQAEVALKQLRRQKATDEKKILLLQSTCTDQQSLIEDLERELQDQEQYCKDLVGHVAQNSTLQSRPNTWSLAEHKKEIKTSTSENSIKSSRVPGGIEDIDDVIADETDSGARVPRHGRNLGAFIKK